MENAAHKQWWQIFEIVFGLPSGIAVVLQILFPLSIPFGDLTLVAAVAGALMVIAGLGFIVLARRQFAQFGQPTDPGHPTSRLVTTGVFSISRNPLYLGGVLVLAGIGLMLNWAWLLLLLVPGLASCYIILILPEERYLAAKFGDEFQTYANTVCRWFGRCGRLR
jgi:protein-S-isoprenylcysteine O-methyltransferase Ste14